MNDSACLIFATWRGAGALKQLSEDAVFLNVKQGRVPIVAGHVQLAVRDDPQVNRAMPYRTPPFFFSFLKKVIQVIQKPLPIVGSCSVGKRFPMKDLKISLQPRTPPISLNCTGCLT